MTALAVSLSPSAEAAVLVELDALPLVGGAYPFTLTRVDTNGASPVRRREGQNPIAGDLILTDHEAALTGPVRYDLVDGNGVTYSASITLAGAGVAPRITNVQLPQRVAVPLAITGYDAARTSSSVVHWPVDRTDPVVVLRKPRTREGTLTAFSSSYADAAAMAATVAPGVTLHLRQGDHPGLDMYFAVLESRVAPEELVDAGWVWTVVATFVEVKAPTLPLLGAAGWTYDDLTAGWTTYAAARGSFGDYGALLVGPL